MKVGFVHIPKTGGTSLRKVYKWFVSSSRKQNAHVHQTLADFPVECGLVFCVIREPRSWLYSLFLQGRYDVDRNKWENLKEIDDFETFIMSDPKSLIRENLDCGCQSDWTVGVPIENILLFENLDEEVRNFFTEHKLPYSLLPKENITKPHEVKNILSDDAITRLQEDFADDFALYQKVTEMRNK